MTEASSRITEACSKHFPTWKNDCSGYLKAVASTLGYVLVGNADQIVDKIATEWTTVDSGVEAARLAGEGKFVVAGLRSNKHTPPRSNGHVVVVIPGALYRTKYPLVWGGSIGTAQSEGNKSVGEVWNQKDRDQVIYRTPK